MAKEILELKARKEFNCLGTDCPRDCCHGWDNINLDDQTTQKWNLTQDQQDKDFLMSFLKTKQDKSVVMKVSKDNVCTALNDDKLCSIQIRFGHEHLSETCRSFPKMNFQNNYRRYKTASLACPAIVKEVLFDTDKNESLFSTLEGDDKNSQENSLHKQFTALDSLLAEILDKSEYPIGIQLFLIADIFIDLIEISESNGLNEASIRQAQNNVDSYLSAILKAVKQGKIKTNSVTSGSIWKNVYELIETRNIDKRFLDESSKLHKLIKQDDNTLSGFSKIYSVIKKYKKQANKQLKREFLPMFIKYIRLSFINNGFPLAPREALNLVLVDSMINICALQLLVWIEFNKHGKLTEQFISNCIVELNRKLAYHNGVIEQLKDDPHMLQIKKYCNTFLDLF